MYEAVARQIQEESQKEKERVSKQKVNEALFLIPHSAAAETLTGVGSEFVKDFKRLEHFKKDRVLVVPGVLRSTPETPKGIAITAREERFLGFVQSVVLGDSQTGRGLGLSQRAVAHYLEAYRLADRADANNDGKIEGAEFDALKGKVKFKFNGEDISVEREELVRNLVILLSVLEPKFSELESALAKVDQQAGKALRQYEDNLMREKGSLLTDEQKKLPRRERTYLLLEKDYETWQKDANKTIVDYLKENVAVSTIIAIVAFGGLQWLGGAAWRGGYNRFIARGDPAKTKLSPKQKAAQVAAQMKELAAQRQAIEAQGRAMQEMFQELEQAKAALAESVARGGPGPKDMAQLQAKLEKVVASQVKAALGRSRPAWKAPSSSPSGAAPAPTPSPTPVPSPVVVSGTAAVAAGATATSWTPLVDAEALGDGFVFEDPIELRFRDRVAWAAHQAGSEVPEFAGGVRTGLREFGQGKMYERGPIDATKDFAKTSFSKEGVEFIVAALAALLGHYIVASVHMDSKKKELAHELIGGGELALGFGFFAYLAKTLYQGGGARGAALAGGQAAGRLIPGIAAALGAGDVIDHALDLYGGMDTPEARWGGRAAAVVLGGIALFISAPFALTAGTTAWVGTEVDKEFNTSRLGDAVLNSTGKPRVEYNKKTGRPVSDGGHVVFTDTDGDKKYLLSWLASRPSFKDKDHDYNGDTLESMLIAGNRKVLETLPRVKEAGTSSIRNAW
ncbi:MAG: hypothetical protein HYY44_09435, partial [Deltaproteobacteria bacterium]|nr:hypothetical protein [Deltaproteobacteria bacterium]